MLGESGQPEFVEVHRPPPPPRNVSGARAGNAPAQNVQTALVQSGQVLYVPVDSDTFKPLLPGEEVDGPVCT